MHGQDTQGKKILKKPLLRKGIGKNWIANGPHYMLMVQTSY
jgi:hypothetical protein